MPYGPSAARGAWSADGKSLVLEVQTLGNDDVARVTHVFGDRTVDLSIEWTNGFRANVQGRRRSEGRCSQAMLEARRRANPTTKCV